MGENIANLFRHIASSDETLDCFLTLLPKHEQPRLFEPLFRRADFLAKEGRLEQARRILARAGALPRDTVLVPANVLAWGEYMYAVLGCTNQISNLYRKYEETRDPNKANEIAWYCVLAPTAIANDEEPVRLAELAVKGFPPSQKHLAMNTLGATLYRAGRSEEAIPTAEGRNQAAERGGRAH